jgi:hypothetical protein
MEQPLFPVPEHTAPAVLLGSGPGPSPALDTAAAPPPPASTTPADTTWIAILDPLDRATGLRGWMLTVHVHGDISKLPRHHFSRAGARPPLIDARLAALAALGFEPADADEKWRWQETTTLDGKRVELYAALDVRRVQRGAEAAL